MLDYYSLVIDKILRSLAALVSSSQGKRFRGYCSTSCDYARLLLAGYRQDTEVSIMLDYYSLVIDKILRSLAALVSSSQGKRSLLEVIHCFWVLEAIAQHPAIMPDYYLLVIDKISSRIGL